MVNPGDRVRISTAKQEFEGTLLPRPAILKDDKVIVKLASGYNIGISKKKIKDIKVLKAYQAPKVSSHDIKNNPDLPTVAFLSFGGTISSRIDYKSGGVIADYGAEDFVSMCPELLEIANVEPKKILSMMSEDMYPEDWKQIIPSILDSLNNEHINGVVVTTGTDTLHYIAAALSFMIKDLNKPIIITASQRSIDRGSSDAFMNIICAVRAAAHWDGAEVAVCMHGTTNDDYCVLIPGTKVRKMHTSRRDAFRPINSNFFAKVTLEHIEPVSSYNKRGKQIPENAAAFEKKTGMLQVYPGMDPKILDFFIDNNYKGLIIAATALGHVPTGKTSLLPKIKKAIKQGMVVVVASQTLYGRTHPYVYTNLRKLSVEAGCLFAQDMLPETAFVKLGWLLGKEKKLDKVKELFAQNISGEINERLTEEMFLL